MTTLNENSTPNQGEQILDTSFVGVMITRVGDDKILYANPAVANLMGISDISKVIGKQGYDFYWDPNEYQALFEKFHAQGFIKSYELRARRANGSMFWVSVSIRSFDFQGEHALISEIIDISERKQAEEALRENELLYQSLIESSPFSICRKDVDGRFTFANRHFLEVSNITSGEVLGKTDYDLHPSELAEKYRHDDLSIMESGQVQEFIEERAVNDGDETSFVQTIKVPIYDVNGKVNGVQISFWDITARMRAEEGIRLFKAMADNAGDAISISDLKGNMVYSNRAVYELLGYDYEKQELNGTPMSVFTPEQEHARQADAMKQILTTGGKFSTEAVSSRKDGSKITIAVTMFPIFDEHKKPTNIGAILRDVTEQKRAEEEILLRDRALAASVNGVIIVSLPSSKPVYVNDSLLKMTGYAYEEAMKLSFLDILGDSEDFKEMQEIVNTQGFYTTEKLIKCKDGSFIPTNFSTAMIKDENGRAIAIQSSFFDISERKQAEKALHDSEERFRRFAEATLEGLVFHEQGKIIDANPAALTMYGLQENRDLISKNLLDFVVPEHHTLVMQKMQSEVVEPYEILCRRSNGSTFPVETSTRTYKEGGRVIRASSLRDISQRKQAEAQLSESETRYQLLSESAIEGIVIHDKGIILDTNQTFATMVGYDPKEVIGMSAMDFLTPETREITAQNIRSGYEKPYDVVGLRKDGSTFPVEITGKAITFQGKTVRVTTLRDITERKQTEQRLQENQELLQLVMNNIPQAVFWKDREDLKYLGVNQAFADDAGFASPDELIGKKDFDMPWKEQAELYRSDDKHVLISGEAKLNYEEPQTDAVGRTTWLRTSKIPMRDINGQVFAILGMYEDITEQKKLQQQVQEALERRGYQVQVSTEISQEVAAASKLDELFKRVVTLTKERLGYYHTQLLRYDPVQDAVVLINGYGEIGQKMLEIDHNMPMGSGLIGTAADTGNTVMRPTLTDDPDWRSNPLLPETKGEIAVPIKWQDQVLGVLDVQSNQAGAITEDDRLLLEGLCGQIAIAIHSSELVKTIRENESRLEEALQSAHLANWEYDVEKDIFTFNDQFYSLFHTTAEQQGGYQIPSAYYAQNFVHPDDLPIVGVEIEKALTSTERHYSRTLEHRILYADGGFGHISVNINVDRDENGKITRYYGANQDITERKKAEDALRESELRYQQILDAITDMVLVKGPKSSIVWANKAFRDFYGMTNEQLLELIDAPIVDPDYTQQYIKDDEHVFETGEIMHIPQEPVTRHDGVAFPFETVKSPLRDLDGKIVMTVGVSRDITERLKERQEMAERLEEINRLYQNLSHEGWKTYREIEDLPKGFVFDRTGVKPVEDASLEENHFTNVPMRVLGGEVVGNLAVADDPQHPMSQEDIDFLNQVSDQIALALEGARLAAQTQASLAQTEELYQASAELNTAVTYENVLSSMRRNTICRDAQNVSLNVFNRPWIGDDEPEWVDVLARWSSLPSSAVMDRYMLSALPSSHYLLHPDTPTAIEDVETNPSLDDNARTLYAKRYGAKSTVFAPLVVSGRWIGYINAIYLERTPFPEAEIRRLTAMAGQAAVIVNNLRLLSETQRQAEREGMLNVISQKIQSATSVEAVLQIAARELGHALGAPMTIAQLSMKDKK
jgi:PAS domain S-box-containing protein